MFKLNYREETNEDLLYGYIIALAERKEFFIAKAMGWALREYAKTNRNRVEQFMAFVALQPLGRREAIFFSLRVCNSTKKFNFDDTKKQPHEKSITLILVFRA